MPPRENYRPFYAAGFGITLAILVIFQVYILREPARIEFDTAADLAVAIQAGRVLYVENCTDCHGDVGEGAVGPALNSRGLLTTVSDEVLFSLTRTGVPGTSMPAWGQVFGGPFTDEQVSQLVAFIRAWEPTAPEIVAEVVEPDPVRGATLYASSCIVCHGQNGEGTDTAPAINDLDRLERFDDAWYRATIANGRPAKGMPTWGSVLAPEQISDLVALVGAWREGQSVTPEISLLTQIGNALFAVRQFDQLDAIYYLSSAQSVASGKEAQNIQQAIDLIRNNSLFEAEALLISLFPPEEMGAELFRTNCTGCHGADGTGGTGPNLHNNQFVQTSSDDELVDLILTGRAGTAMKGFDRIMIAEDVINLVALLQTWQD